jgi:ABC-type multidrug transport system fused ATPase/permease subunit
VLDTLDHAAYARSLGVLFQDFQSYEDFTVRDAVWFGDVEKPRTDEAVYSALERAGAREFVEKLPQKLGSYMSAWMDKDNGSDLSGGQRQRIAIARTLFRDPDILIMDEPTSAIDAKAEYEIFKELEANRRGKTTILISHRFSTVRKADTIIVLSKGCSIEAGSHTELMERRGVYYDLFTKQAEGYI